MSDHCLYMLAEEREELRTLLGRRGRSSGRREEEEGARPDHHQEGGREEKEEKGQPDQAPLPWWSWSFHAGRVPVCV